MAHLSLFALLAVLFSLFAFAAARADLWIVAIPAAIGAVWFCDLVRLSARGVLRKRAARNGTGR